MRPARGGIDHSTPSNPEATRRPSLPCGGCKIKDNTIISVTPENLAARLKMKEEGSPGNGALLPIMSKHRLWYWLLITIIPEVHRPEDLHSKGKQEGMPPQQDVTDRALHRLPARLTRDHAPRTVHHQAHLGPCTQDHALSGSPGTVHRHRVGPSPPPPGPALGDGPQSALSL